eukprot:16014-Heterococcus_DN1.PRE.2
MTITRLHYRWYWTEYSIQYTLLLSGVGYWPVYPVSVITGMRTGVGMPDSRLPHNRYSSAGYRITG